MTFHFTGFSVSKCFPNRSLSTVQLYGYVFVKLIGNLDAINLYVQTLGHPNSERRRKLLFEENYVVQLHFRRLCFEYGEIRTRIL